jgi:hypothetical protein
MVSPEVTRICGIPEDSAIKLQALIQKVELISLQIL